MLRITVPAGEQYWEGTNTFTSSKEQVLQLEHSLVSLSKWEGRWKKPFLTKEVKTQEETIDYIKCMTITQNVDENVYYNITSENLAEVTAYIEAEMTATRFSNLEQKTNREIVTAELIYYWMIAMNIPFECQKWHLSRLLTLINVCSIKNAPAKKMGKRELARRNASLNESRQRAMRLAAGGDSDGRF